MSIFEYPLDELAESHREPYARARPFPHVVLDGIVRANVLDAALAEYPNPGALNFIRYDNALEKKLAFDQVDQLPAPIRLVLSELNSPSFLRFLERLTGIQNLIADHTYRGGGIHLIPPGGKLDIHADFNIHHGLMLHRRLNLLLYLNRDWPDSYGGQLELWRGEMTEAGPVLSQCEQRIVPVFNRMVIFTTSETSFHGHPEPVSCPLDRARRSLALYYYSPIAKDLKGHSTVFVKRPEEASTPELDAFRRVRSYGRRIEFSRRLGVVVTLADREVTGEVVDLTVHSLAFLVNSSHGFEPNIRPGALSVRLPDGILRASGIVRSLHVQPDQRVRVGVELDSLSRDAHDLVERFRASEGY